MKTTDLRRGDPVEYQICNIKYKGFVDEDKTLNGQAHIRVTEEDGVEKKTLTMLVPTRILTRA